MQFLPTLSSTCSHFPVEDIAAGNCVLSMPSFTDFPFGADMFRMMRAPPFGFTLHIIPFTFAPTGRSSLFTGPNANPFVTQSHTASVISRGKSIALAAFVLIVLPLYSPLHPMSAPSVRSVHTTLSISPSLHPSVSANPSILAGFTRDFAGQESHRGNFSQKLSGAACA